MINPEKFFLAVIFTGLVTAYTGFWGEINTSAIAATYITATHSPILNSSVFPLDELTKDSTFLGNKQTPVPTLPPGVYSAIQNNLQQLTGIDRKNFTITSFTPRTWPDACLGLASSNQVCAQVMIPGWRVVINGNNPSSTWIYRTNRDGTVLRLER